MNKLIFILGAIISKISTYPSRNFMIFTVCLLSAISLYLSSSIFPLFSHLPGFISEWTNVKTINEFAAFLCLFSYVMLFAASLMTIKRAAFLSAYFLKLKFGITIVPKC